MKNLRWWIIALVALATVINYIDRNALAIMWPEISADLGLTTEDYALIVSFFMVGYAIGQSLFGKIFDWIGTRIGFVLAIVVWSIAITMHALARGVMSFGLVRFFLAIGEAGNWPGATKNNAEWFPIKERALAQGVFNAGASVGALISTPLIAFMFLWLGWQGTFVVIGLVGVLWIIPWLFLYKAPPDRHPWLSEEERDYILKGQVEEKDEASGEQEVEQLAPSFLELLSIRQSWSVIASRFFLDPVWWMFVTWLPLYLVAQFDFDIKQIGLFGWVPYAGAAAGSLFGGWLAKRLFALEWSINKTRKFTITLGGSIMLPVLVATAFAAEPLLAVFLIAIILFGFQLAIGNIQTLPSDFYSGKSVGSLAGIGGTAAVVGVLITTNVVPMLTQVSWVPFFLLGAVIVPLAIASVWIFGGHIQQLKEENE
ncbi:MAG: MFS transporter [Gammaproteobacteria bacterium]|nr:MFS transporter [Gammaproteobacteria bacterium]